MKNLSKHLTISLIISVFLFVSQALAQPLAYVQTIVSPTHVYVCNDPGGFWPCNPGREYGPISYEGDYIPHVLANEWPAQSGTESLKAGAIAIRTFGWRNAPCGAVSYDMTVGGTEYHVEHNGAQAYWGCCTPATRHYDAVNATADKAIRNHYSAELICAKYKADCGDPTAYGAEEPDTLTSVPDPVDSDNMNFSASGLSQNGSHAWELYNYSQSAPWDYRQILTHYYAYIDMTGLAFNRWTWLDPDVAGGIRHTSNYGEQYYGPRTNTPGSMYTSLIYQVPFHVQNTSAYVWRCWRRLPGAFFLSLV